MFRTLAIALFSLSLCPSSEAQEMPDLDEIVQVRLIEGWQLPSGAHMGALQVTLAPDWKTYWRVGGDTGIPPRFNWDQSVNLGAAIAHWPRPHILRVNGVEILGYKNELVLPIEFSPAILGEPIQARANLELGVCKDICIPVKTRIAADLGPQDGPDRFLVELALADGAMPAQSLGIPKATCRIENVNDGVRITARIDLPDNIEAPGAVMFETQNPDIWVTKATHNLSGGRFRSDVLFLSYDGSDIEVAEDDIRITLISENQALDFQGCSFQ